MRSGAKVDHSYDAFISYTGFCKKGSEAEFDRIVAERLHKVLETYRVPKALIKKSAPGHPIPRRLKKIFRDRDEVRVSPNLNDSLVGSLQKSRFLIVICSPRAIKSQWINQEISIFRSLGREDRILPILIEGEPHEAFPSELLKYKPKTSLSKYQSYLPADILAQPLAADIRADSQAASLRLLKQEKLRLIASILGCDYDALRQRENERFMKRALSAGTAMAILLIILSTLSALLLIAQRRERRNAELAIKSTSLIPFLTSPDINFINNSPVTREVKLKQSIADLEALQNDYPDNVQLLVTLRSVYGALATTLSEQGRREEANTALGTAKSMIIPIAIGRLKSWDDAQEKVSSDLFSITDDPERKRLLNLLKIWGEPGYKANLTMAIEYIDNACEYLLLLDVSTKEGRDEAQRVLKLGIELFNQAKTQTVITGEIIKLVAELNKALNKIIELSSQESASGSHSSGTVNRRASGQFAGLRAGNI